MSLAFTAGTTTIHRIEESVGANFEALQFFPTLTKERLEDNRHWLEPVFIEPGSSKLRFAVQSYLVRTGGRTILIDSCVGNDKPRPARPFWHLQTHDRYMRALAAAGAGVADIDIVMCTHLHVDHVGWNTRLDNGRWIPTFPNARYLFADRELAFWTERQQAQPESCPWVTDSVLPIVAARRADIVRSDLAFADGVQLVPTPGHTIDHFAVLIGRPGADALVCGDMIHSPIQALHPEIGMMADYDSKQAEASRRRIFERFCDSATLLCTGHFPAPSTGRVTRRGTGFQVGHPG